MTLSKATTIGLAALLNSLAERAPVTPRNTKMLGRQTVGCGEVCNSTQVSGGRGCSCQRLLMLFVRAFWGFTAANLASISFLSTSREG